MPVLIFDQTNSDSSCYLLTSERDQDNSLNFVVVNERRLKFIQANSQ